MPLLKTKTIIEMCLKRSDIEDHEDVSMDDFTAKAIKIIKQAEDAYYPPLMDERKVDMLLTKARRVLKAAKVFNKHFGF